MDLGRRKIAGWIVAAGLAGHAFFLPVSIAGMQIALAAAAFGLLLAWERPARSPLDLPILAFVALAVLSDLWSPYGPPSLGQATLWRAAAGFFVVSAGARRPRLLLSFAAAGLLLASIAGLVQYRTGIDFVYLLHLRGRHAMVQAPGVPGRFGAMGFFTSRLGFGHVATVLIALFAGTLARRRGSWLLAVAAAVAVAAVGVTFDRAAWLALCAAAVVIALFAAPQARRAGLAVVAAAAAVVAVVPAIRARFATAFSAQANPDRVFIWSRALEIIRDHPLRGVGFANYQRMLGPYYDRVDPHFFMRTYAHNLELSTLAETGPLGLLALLWVLGAAFRALWQRRALGGLAALAAWLAIAQVHDVFYDNKVMYALWFALGLSLRRPGGSPSPSPPAATAG